ncbi:MAG: hypothetical protein ABSG95_09375 [Solirubrobacteraceae bacterium]|jgi:hypothetical protein
MEPTTPYERSFDATVGAQLTKQDDQRVSAQRDVVRLAGLNRDAWLPTAWLA